MNFEWDENIDYSDIPPVTEEIIKRVENDTTFVVNVDKEIAVWIRNSKIDFDNMINQWLLTVYNNFGKNRASVYHRR